MDKILSQIKKLWSYKITVIALLLIMISIAVGLFLEKAREGIVPKPAITIGPIVFIDTTDDERALGYTGQKKIIKDNWGNIYISYRKKSNGYYEVYVSRATKNPDGSWKISNNKEPAAPVSNKTNQRVPSLTADNNNVLHLTWYGADSNKEENNRQIKYSRSEDSGKTWSKWVNVSVVDGYDGQDLWQEHPDILATSEGKLYIIWEGKDSENKNQQIKLSTSSDNGNSWSKWININPTPSASHSRPTVIEDNRGRIHIFMYSSRNLSTQQIWHSYSDNGREWSEWENISKNAFDSRHVSAVIDKQSNIYVVWRSADDRNKTNIYYSIYNGQNWSVPLAVQRSDQYQFFPDIGLDSSNNLFIAWMESSNESGFPNENPQNGKVYFAALDRSKINLLKIQEIVGNNVLYPHLLKNNERGQTDLLYLDKEKQVYGVNLVNIKI